MKENKTLIKNKINNFTEKQMEIINFIKKNGEAKPVDIFTSIKVTKQRFYVIVSPLIKNGNIIKNGKTPKVFYSINSDVFFGEKNKQNEITKEINIETHIKK